MLITSQKDIENARRIMRDAQNVRVALHQALIMAGAWEPDAVDRVMNDSAETIEIGSDGSVHGLHTLITSYREHNPDAFIKLGPIAMNEKLPTMTRFAAAYRDVLKAQERRKRLSRAQATALHSLGRRDRSA